MKQAIKDKVNALLAFFREQLKDASTLRGIAMLLGSLALFTGRDPTVVLTLVTFAAGLLGVLEQATGAMSTFLNSTRGQETLRQFFADAEGDLFVTGRVDDMIISGGENKIGRAHV